MSRRPRPGATLRIRISAADGISLSGTPSTLVCPGNIVANCVGNDPPVSTDTFIGTVSGNNVQINISYVNTQGTDNITLTGTVSGRQTGQLRCATYSKRICLRVSWVELEKLCRPDDADSLVTLEIHKCCITAYEVVSIGSNRSLQEFVIVGIATN